MSFATQAQKRHFAGRSFLSPEEVKMHIPWYASSAWQERKQAIARRVAKRVERATLRRLEREDLARGISPEMVQARSAERVAEMHPESLSLFARVWRFVTRLWKR